MKFKMLLPLVLITLLQTAMAADLPTYFNAPFKDLASLKKSLQSQQFEILGEYHVNKNSKFNVLFITHPSLKSVADTKKRGFASILRVMHDSQNKVIRATNPTYFLNAFLQDDFKPAVAKDIHGKLAMSLGKLTPSTDKLSQDKLSDYHFTFMMPYYKDFIKVGSGKAEELVKKMKKNAGENLVFVKKLSEGRYIASVGLPGEIEGFLTTLKSENNSVLMPYTVLIEKNKAYIMDPKYYLAISLPQLEMGQFMTIANIPDKIKSAFFKVFDY
jgi:hypothetical protein